MKVLFAVTIVVSAALISCSQPTEITARQVAAMSRPSEAIPTQLTFQMKVNEGRFSSKSLPTTPIIVGKSFTVSDQREFIYPAAYKPASSSSEQELVTPATPLAFQTIETGIKADLTSERVGSLVVVKGTITVTEFQGFSRMGGELGLPIIDSKGRMITENRIEMPKLATFATPIFSGLKVGGESTFEISHPEKGTSVTFAISPTH